MNNKRNNLYKLTVISVFCAIVVVLQCTLGVVTVGPVNLNFVLIPILISGMLFGKTAGTLAGVAFGVTTYIQCITGTQAFGAMLFEINWFYDFIICVVRGAVVGFVPAFVYWLLSKFMKNQYAKTIICSAVAPIVNTGLFILLFALLYNAKVHEMMADAGTGIMYFLFIVVPGLNFIVELASSLLITPPVAVALSKTKEKNKLN